MPAGVGWRLSFALILLTLTITGCVSPTSTEGITLVSPAGSVDLPVTHTVMLKPGTGMVMIEGRSLSPIVGFLQHGAAEPSVEGPSLDIVLVGSEEVFFPAPRELRDRPFDGGRPLFVGAPGASASKTLDEAPYGGFSSYSFPVELDDSSVFLVIFWANLSAPVEVKTFWGEGTILTDHTAEALRVRSHEFADGVAIGASVAATGRVNSSFVTGSDGDRHLFLAKVANPLIGGPSIRLTDEEGTRELETDPRPFAYNRFIFTTRGRAVVDVGEVSLGDSELSFQYAALPVGAPFPDKSGA